jgi:hypothetical protein
MSSFEREVAKLALKSLTATTKPTPVTAEAKEKKDKKSKKEKNKKRKSSRGRSRHRSRSHGRRSRKSHSHKAESATYSSSDSCSTSSDPMQDEVSNFFLSYKFQFYKRLSLPEGAFSYGTLPIQLVKEVLHVLNPARYPAQAHGFTSQLGNQHVSSRLLQPSDFC